MDTTKIRDRQNYEMSQLNQDFQKRKERLVQEQEAELAQIRDYYSAKEENLRENSEATVNHLRERSQQAVTQQEESGRRNL